MSGLFVHGFVVLPLIFSLVTRQLPFRYIDNMFFMTKTCQNIKREQLFFRFIANMANAITTAFGTGSSSATLPVTIGLLETKNGVDPRVCRWVISTLSL